MRKIPEPFGQPGQDEPPAPAEPLKVSVRIVTEMYGGGVEPGKQDPVTPFRVPEIRGHLRFWWRATLGGGFADAGQLRGAEEAVWGSTQRASRISLLAVPQFEGTPNAVDSDLERKYVHFAALETAEPGTSPQAYHDGCFDLLVDGPRGIDLQGALWAWLTFGGLGARSRRGLGAPFSALFTDKLPERCSAADAQTWLRSMARCYLKGDGSTRPWPTLKGAIVVLGAEPADPAEAWLRSVRAFRAFRQEKQGAGRHAKNVWPEANVIRNGTGDQFPRAVLGLPIQFHFPEKGGEGEKHTLEPANGQHRMASPVLVRPLVVHPECAFPMLVILNTDAQEQVENLLLDGQPVRRRREMVLRSLVNKVAAAWGTESFAL